MDLVQLCYIQHDLFFCYFCFSFALSKSTFYKLNSIHLKDLEIIFSQNNQYCLMLKQPCWLPFHDPEKCNSISCKHKSRSYQKLVVATATRTRSAKLLLGPPLLGFAKFIYILSNLTPSYTSLKCCHTYPIQTALDPFICSAN